MGPEDRDWVLGARVGKELAVVRSEEESRELGGLVGVEKGIESLRQEERRRVAGDRRHPWAFLLVSSSSSSDLFLLGSCLSIEETMTRASKLDDDNVVSCVGICLCSLLFFPLPITGRSGEENRTSKQKLVCGDVLLWEDQKWRRGEHAHQGR